MEQLVPELRIEGIRKDRWSVANARKQTVGARPCSRRVGGAAIR